MQKSNYDLPSIPLGNAYRRDAFDEEHEYEQQHLSFDEDGLRRHVLIAGGTGSGKTVAARYIIEQAAIQGVPSIVIDAQGDLSSLVLASADPSADAFLKVATAVHPPADAGDAADLKSRIEKHLSAIETLPRQISQDYANRCVPRIFTPARPDLGLPLSFPPYLDIDTVEESAGNEAQVHELEELLHEEVQSLVRLLFASKKKELYPDYEELFIRLFRHAHLQGLSLEGKSGVECMIDLVVKSHSFASDLVGSQITERGIEDLTKRLRRLTFSREDKWFEGEVLNIGRLIDRPVEGRTPINIIHVHHLSSDDRRRVIRYIASEVYRFGVMNPRQAGAPSLILYIDEVGTGYADRSIAVRADIEHRVFEVLNRLARQARKYGVSMIMASQAYTDFAPEIRRQLTTKIIGKVDDAAELSRIAKQLPGDLAEGGQSPRDLLEKELPRLGPPRLLFVSTRGEARTYKQLKCVSLDITLRQKDIGNWRHSFEQNMWAVVNSLKGKVQRSEKCLGDVLAAMCEGQFVPELNDELWPLKIQLLVRAGDLTQAQFDFRTMRVPSRVDKWLEVSMEIADALMAASRTNEAIDILQRARTVALETSHRLRDDITLRAMKIKLFQDRSLAIDDGMFEGSSSDFAGLFMRVWKILKHAFVGWAGAERFLTDEQQDTRFVESSDDPLVIRVTRVPGSRDDTVEAELYESELKRRPELLEFGRDPALHTPPTGSSYKLADWQTAVQHQRSRFLRAKNLREQGATAEAVRLLEEYLDNQITTSPEDHELVAEFDHDPRVLRRRVELWVQGLSWQDFELEVARLFSNMGYSAWATRASGDGGVDVRAKRGNERVIVQCKHWNRPVGLAPVQAIAGAMQEEGANSAVLVTSSTLEPGAISWAKRNDIGVFDGAKLVDLFVEQEMQRRSTPFPQPDRTEQELTPTPNSNNVQSSVTRASPMPATPTRTPSISEKDDLVLRLCKVNQSIVNADVRMALGVKSQAASSRLRGLVAKGLLRMEGDKRTARYTLTYDDLEWSVSNQATSQSKETDLESPSLPSESAGKRAATAAEGQSRGATMDGEIQVLELCRRKGSIANSDVRELLGVSRNEAGVKLRRLVARGLLVMNGQRRSATYALPSSTGSVTPRTGEVSHDEKATPIRHSYGSISHYNPEKGYGFLQPDEDGESAYFHRANLLSKVHELLLVSGRRVCYKAGRNDRGACAHEIQVLLAEDEMQAETQSRHGEVIRIDANYGWVRDRHSGVHVFFHRSYFPNSGDWDTLGLGSKILFDVEATEKGLQAVPGSVFSMQSST